MMRDVSLGQERIWSVCQANSGLPVYNMGFSMYLVGEFDTEISEAAINIILSRHEILRATFTVVDNQLKQVIAPSLNIKINTIFRTHVPIEAAHDEIQKIAKAEMLKPFDLERGPLVRGSVVKFADNHCGWIVTMHHVVGDGWSMGLFINEMNIIYRALADRAPISLTELDQQYSAYVNLQREKINIDSFNYWKQRLNGVKSLSSENSDISFTRYQYPISSELIAKLNNLSKEYQTTLFIILLVGLRITLWQQTGETDAIITVPTANRNNYKLQKTIGYFVNLLPLRSIIASDLLLKDYILQVMAEVQEDFKHQDVPIEYISQQLGLDKPLFQTLFSLLNYPIPSNLYKYELKEVSDYTDISEFNLSIRVSTFKKASDIEIIYNPDVHTKDGIENLIQHYMTTLDLLQDSKNLPIAQIKKFSEAS